MAKTWYLLLLTCILIPASVALGQEFTNETTVSGTFDGNPVEYYLATNKAVYARDDSVWMKFAITNIGDEPVTYFFATLPASCIIQVLNGAQGLIWIYPEGGWGAVWEATLDTNETLTETVLGPSAESAFITFNPYYVVARPNTWLDFTPDSISVEFCFSQTSVEASDEPLIPQKFALFQNYPNPFNSSTTIAYHLPKPGEVKLSIYDVSGRLVKTIVDEHRPAGIHTAVWNTKGLSSGVYFYQFVARDFLDVKKCVLLK